MLVIFLIALETLFGTVPALGTGQQPRGPIRSVYAERATTNLTAGESHRVPWYKESYDNRARLIEAVFFKEDGSVNNTWVYGYASDDKRSEAIIYDSDNLL